MKNFPLMRLQARAQFLAFCAAALLAGCGGGGGSAPATTQTGNPPPVPTQRIPDSSNASGSALSFPRELPREKNPRSAQEIADAASREAEFLESPEFKKSWHLKFINAHKAYARGATGADEIVGVIDQSLHLENDEFAGGKIVVANLDTSGQARRQFLHTHGTQVASVAVGARGGSPSNEVQGVAYEAKLAFGDNGNVSIGYPGNIASVSFFAKHGAAVVNVSLGEAAYSIDKYTKEEVRKGWGHIARELAQTGTNDADKIIFVRSAGNDDDMSSPTPLAAIGVHFPELRGHVLAVTGVNEFGNQIWTPCGSAKAFCLAAPARNIWTGSMRKKKRLKKRNHFSSDEVESSVDTFDGTSSAAPIVSGALALLRHYFRDTDGTRQLGNTELVARLLATANRTGKYFDADKYGHGLLDLDAATKPYGMLMTSLQSDPNAQPFNPAAFSLSGNAFGGAMRDALGGVKIAAFDELDAPFFFPLADGVSHAPQISAGYSDTLHEHELSLGDAANASLALSLAAGELSAARIRRGNLWFSYGHHGGREAGLYFGDDGGNTPENFGMNFSDENSAENVANAARHFRAPLAFASPYLSLVRDGPGLGWSQPLRSGARFGFSLMHGAPQFDHFQNPGGARGLGALFDFRPNNTSLSLQAGAVREADGFLGARAQGNFGEISADTAFAGIGGDWAAMQDWRLLASAYLGHTKADTGGGMLRAADDIVSSAFSLGLARAGLARRGDWLGLRLSQPLRAESGAAHLRIPAGRTKYREVIHRQHKLELTPSGRNLQVEAEYRVPFAGGNLRAGLGFDRHANHDRARDLETFLRLGFDLRF